MASRCCKGPTCIRAFDSVGAYSYDPSLPDYFNDLTYVAGGYGYWVKLQTAGALDFGSNRACVPSPPATPDACATVYTPVCGCDGQTYGNACEAGNAGVWVAYEGECR